MWSKDGQHTRKLYYRGIDCDGLTFLVTISIFTTWKRAF